MVVFYSTLVLSVIGLVAGLFLAYSAEVFKVQEDPRLKKLLEILPGANCGACGYPGCEGYAKAVLKGEAPTDRCLPGKKSNVEEKIKSILSE